MRHIFEPYSIWYDELTNDVSYIDELKALSGSFGYTGNDIDELLESGVTPEEIEDWFYSCGEEV